MTTEQLYVWLYGDTGFCGCGDPQAAARTLTSLLELCRPGDMNAQRDRRSLMPESGVYYLMLYRLDDLGLTEHGGSVDGAWLTDRGKEVMAALQIERELDNFHRLLEEQRCAHGVLFTEENHDCQLAEDDLAADRAEQASPRKITLLDAAERPLVQWYIPADAEMRVDMLGQRIDTAQSQPSRSPTSTNARISETARDSHKRE